MCEDTSAWVVSGLDSSEMQGGRAEGREASPIPTLEGRREGLKQAFVNPGPTQRNRGKRVALKQEERGHYREGS